MSFRLQLIAADDRMQLIAVAARLHLIAAPALEATFRGTEAYEE